MQPWAEIFRLTGSQSEAVLARGQDVIVKAGAGSGKTSTLVARYLSLLDEGCLPRGVVAITFTEKAAREMRNRIRQAIHQLLAGPGLTEDRARWQAIEADIDAARIGTIHGLCAALLRAHPAEAGVDPQFDVLEEGRAATLRAQAVEAALAWGIEQPGLQALFAAISADELSRSLSKLLEGRLEASGLFDVPDWPDKWRTAVAEALQRFAARDDVQPALAELRALTRSKSGLVDDAGEKLVEPIETLVANWAVFEAAADPLAAALALYTTRHAYRPGSAGKKTSQARAAAKAWCEAYDAQLQDWLGGKDKSDPAPDAALEQQAAETVGGLRQLFEKACAIYQGAKETLHSLDFDDLEAGALRLLERGDIRARWQRQIDALLVDEFQDTNERQRRIVEALAGRPEGKVGRLFVVGDEKQSIYRFRGADVTVFRRLDRDIRARGGLPLALNRTFRAHQALVETLNELLGAVIGAADDPARPFAVPFAKLQADRADSRRGAAAPYLEVLLGLGENADEARGSAAQLLAQRLRQLHDTTQLQWEHMALLFRASTGFPDYEAALEAEGIPFVTVAGRGFYARPEIRDLLNSLHALADPSDDLALAGLLRSPAFGLSDVALYQLRWPPGASRGQSYRTALAGDLSHLSEIDRQQAEQARDRRAHLMGLVDRVSVAELLKQILELTLYPAVLAATEAGARLQRNVEKLLADAHTSGLVRVSEFLEYLETLQAVGAREGEAPTEAGGAVRLMTVHKAKGLQFPLVVLADAARSRPNVSEPTLLSSAYGVVPGKGRRAQAPLIFHLAKHAENDQAEAEDLRLLYVAATRVEEKLIVCGHHSNRAADSWLAKLLGAVGLDPANMAAKPETWNTVTLPGCQQTVSGWAAAGVSQTERAGAGTPRAVPAPQATVADNQAAPLYRSLFLPVEDEVNEPPEKHVLRARRVTGRYRQLDGALVGELVHLAIRWWRFPGHSNLESLLQTALLERGVVDPAEAEAHVRRAIELLARLKADVRWRELDAADRHHEVPYSLVQGERPVNGFIDLLYCGPDDRWRIIDFKTDAIEDEPGLERLLAESYQRQLQRYQAAIQTLLGQPAQSTLCLLDYAGGVLWKLVGGI